MNGTANKKDLHRRAIISLVICALLWSTAGFVLKSVKVMDGMRISGYRCLIAAVVLTLVNRKLPAVNWKNRWFLIGCIAYAIGSWCIVQSNLLTTAANSVILQYTAPVFVCIIGVVFLHQKMVRSNYAVIGALLAGLVVFFLDSISLEQSHMLGNGIAVLAGFAMAFQATAVCQMPSAEYTRSIIIIGCMINFLICLPMMEHTPAPVSDYLWVAFLGTCQLGVSYTLYSWAVRYLSPLEVILIPAIEPLANTLLTMLIRGEVPSVNTIAGGLIIIGSITLWSMRKEARG